MSKLFICIDTDYVYNDYALYITLTYMSKTVLLPDELYKEIQETEIELYGVKVEQSMAKKIKFFFEVYKVEKMIDEGTETLESVREKNRHVMNEIEDERIRIDTRWENPGLIK